MDLEIIIFVIIKFVFRVSPFFEGYFSNKLFKLFLILVNDAFQMIHTKMRSLKI